MGRHFIREEEKLKKMILTLSAVTEESVHKSVNAIERRDAMLAKRIVEADIEIDHMEVDVEEEALKLLALYHPVATDLRFIIAVIKINNDLERIGDLAVNIAERAVFLANRPRVDIPFDFPGMAEKAQAMLKRSLDALVNWDAEVARQVCASDDAVDDMNRNMYARVMQGIRDHPSDLEALIHLLAVSRNLERIADHATNIAEDVIYMIDGEIVRHSPEKIKHPGGK